MRRRALLTALATGTAALSGCLAAASERTASSPHRSGADSPGSRADRPTGTASGSPVESPRATGDGAVHRVVEVASRDRVPDEHDVDVDVTLVRPRVTAAETARLRVTTTNRGPRRGLVVQSGPCALLDRSHGGSDPAGVWLHRREKSADIVRDGDRWTRDPQAGRPRAITYYGCLPTPFDPGESVTTEYLLWDDYRAGGYMPPDTYRFEAPVEIAEGTQPTAGVVESFTWGFSLQVRRPGHSSSSLVLRCR